MHIKIIKNILIIFLFYFSFGILSAEENLKSLGKFKDWESFKLLQDGNKICYAQSIPVIRAPKKLKRDPSRLFVSFRPSEKIKNEVSVTNGDEFKVKSYPNPVDNVLTVSHKGLPSSLVNLSIVDVLGQVVLLIEDNMSFEIEEQIRSINVSSLNNGNYFLRISSESIVESIPFVVYH